MEHCHLPFRRRSNAEAVHYGLRIRMLPGQACGLLRVAAQGSVQSGAYDPRSGWTRRGRAAMTGRPRWAREVRWRGSW